MGSANKLKYYDGGVWISTGKSLEEFVALLEPVPLLELIELLADQVEYEEQPAEEDMRAVYRRGTELGVEALVDVCPEEHHVDQVREEVQDSLNQKRQLS